MLGSGETGEFWLAVTEHCIDFIIFYFISDLFQF